jgi:predicted nucleic acid-binding protein
VRLFLDTSVVLAACGSERGASREIFRVAPDFGWVLLVTPYVLDEVIANLPSLPSSAAVDWGHLRSDLALMDDVLTIDRAAVFERAKDRPILFSALAWADVLLTLDRSDFGTLLGSTFYELSILTPGMFLERERREGRMPTK